VATTVSEDTDSERESDTAWPIQKHVAPQETLVMSSVIVPVDPTKVFVYGCPTIDPIIGQEWPYKSRPEWSSGVWDHLAGTRCGDRCLQPIDANLYREMYWPEQFAIIRVNYRPREFEDGTTRAPDLDPSLVGARVAVIWSAA
jgi:hypothetical protein